MKCFSRTKWKNLCNCAPSLFLFTSFLTITQKHVHVEEIVRTSRNTKTCGNQVSPFIKEWLNIKFNVNIAFDIKLFVNRRYCQRNIGSFPLGLSKKILN